MSLYKCSVYGLCCWCLSSRSIIYQQCRANQDLLEEKQLDIYNELTSETVDHRWVSEAEKGMIYLVKRDTTEAQ